MNEDLRLYRRPKRPSSDVCDPYSGKYDISGKLRQLELHPRITSATNDANIANTKDENEGYTRLISEHVNKDESDRGCQPWGQQGNPILDFWKDLQQLH